MLLLPLLGDVLTCVKKDSWPYWKPLPLFFLNLNPFRLSVGEFGGLFGQFWLINYFLYGYQAVFTQVMEVGFVGLPIYVLCQNLNRGQQWMKACKIT